MGARARRRGAAIVAVATAALTMTGCVAGPGEIDMDQDRPFVLGGVGDLTEIAQLTGPDAINDTESVGVAGTDLGSMVNLGDRTYFLFGDTFGERDPDSSGGQGGFWRSNVAAWTTDAEDVGGRRSCKRPRAAIASSSAPPTILGQAPAPAMAGASAEPATAASRQ